MNLLHPFNQYIRQNFLFQKNDKLLIAVSGGVDSVVLCDLCFASGFDFEIAHCNFQLRGDDSDEDELFVRRLAEKYGVPFQVVRFDTMEYAAANKLNVQLAARHLRYEWFNRIAGEINCHHILTAHHANDNAETIVMNFFKGTGIAGLTGMEPKGSGIGGNITRPLLFASKQSLIGYAAEKNLQWREDVSNASDKYTRNFVRNEWLPSIEKHIPNATFNLIENIERFKDAELLYESSLEKFKSGLLLKKGEEIHVPVMKLQKTPAYKTIYFEIIRHYGFTSAQMKDALQLLDADSGKQILSPTHRLIKNRNWLIICPAKNEESSIVIIEEEESVIRYDGHTLIIEKINSPFDLSTETSVGYADASKLTFPLILRKWKTGDYFYPLGMNKKKKLSRFFIDRKMSVAEKEKTWVVESGKKIIWIAGLRIDDRVKLTPATKNAIRFSLTDTQ